MVEKRAGKVPTINGEEYEAVCKRCGVCCGAEDGDPCLNLGRLPDGKYFCRIYEKRFGMQRTMKGNQFRCIPIKAALLCSDLKKRCAYAKVHESELKGEETRNL